VQDQKGRVPLAARLGKLENSRKPESVDMKLTRSSISRLSELQRIETPRAKCEYEL